MGDEILMKQMGARIHSRRKMLGMTQEQLAEKMEVSIQMVSNLELGKKAIRPENLIKLCDNLNVSADYILRGTCSEFKDSEIIRKIQLLSCENQKLLDMIINTWIEK